MSDSPGGSHREISAEQRSEAIELVGKIRSTVYTDEEQVQLTNELKRLIPYPEWDNLMFWHTPDLSDEEAVDKALAYRPIEL